MSETRCPSATCAPGATLLGARGADGRIKHLRTPMVIDAEFVARARAAGEPEARMRFTAPCAEGACSHWTGQACGLIDRVLRHVDGAGQDPRSGDLPPCTIRKSCRWFGQQGRAACAVCDLVVRQPDAEKAPETVW